METWYSGARVFVRISGEDGDMVEEVVDGVVERITYQNPTNDYTVARVRSDGEGALITVVGILPGLREGEQVSLTGVIMGAFI